MSEKWLTMRAADLGRAIGCGDIDPVDLTETYLSAIDAHPYRDKIFTTVTKTRARAEVKAAALRAANGTRRGVLDGVPISWKDLYDSAGVATEAGSALLAGRVPDQDAEVLANATRAGLVCLGKTHMTELAFSGLGLNPVTQTPPNVNNPALAPGGSSSGAATSVAFGLAAAGIGSDTGGSVRIPAAWNNLVGLKTTSGLLSLKGVVPLAARFDTVGPLCRSVEDAALLTAAMSGASAPDLSNASLSGRRFAVLETTALDDCHPQVLAAFEDAVTDCENAGAIVTRISIPGVARSLELAACIYVVEAYAEWGKLIESAPEKMYAAVRVRFEAGRDYSGVEYVRNWKELDQIRQDYYAATAGYDAVLLPSSPNPPPDRERLLSDQDYFIAQNLLALRNTRIGNLMEVATLTLPTSTPGCGIMAMGSPFGESRLLKIGAGIEQALGLL